MHSLNGVGKAYIVVDHLYKMILGWKGKVTRCETLCCLFRPQLAASVRLKMIEKSFGFMNENKIIHKLRFLLLKSFFSYTLLSVTSTRGPL